MIKPQYSSIGRIRQLVIFHPEPITPREEITNKPCCKAFDDLKEEYRDLLQSFQYAEVYLLATYSKFDPNWAYYKVPFTNLHIVAHNTINQTDRNLNQWTQDDFHIASSSYGGIHQTLVYFSEDEISKQGMLRLVGYIAREPKQCLIRPVKPQFNGGDILVGCFEGADYLLFGKNAAEAYDFNTIRQIYKARYAFHVELGLGNNELAKRFLYHVDLFLTIVGQKYGALDNKELILLAELDDREGQASGFPEDIRAALNNVECWLKKKQMHEPVEFEVIRIPMPVVRQGKEVVLVSYNNGIVENYVEEGHHITNLYLPKYSSNSGLKSAGLNVVEENIKNTLSERNIAVTFVEHKFYNLLRDRKGALHCRIKPVMRSIC